MIRPSVLLSTLSLACASTLAFAQPAAPARGPDTALSLEAVQAAACTANNIKAGASVVDSAGVLRVMFSANGASQGAVESSTKKAYTAALLRDSTYNLQEKMKTDQALTEKVNADKSLFVRPGAVPLMVGNEVIGAIGVGGGQTLNGVPGGERDAMCAQAGADKIKDRLK